MKKLIVIISSFFLLASDYANGQISNDLEQILNSAFQYPSLSNLIFDKSFIKNGAVYVYINKEFTYHASNRYKDSVDFPGWAVGMVHLFDMQDHKVYGFGGVVEFAAHTGGEVDTVVVMDKLSYDKTTAILRFNTTNLSSQWFHKKTKPHEKFSSVKIRLFKKGVGWTVASVAIRETPFTSILDRDR